MWGVVLHNVVKPVAVAAILHVVNDLAVRSTTFVCANEILGHSGHINNSNAPLANFTLNIYTTKCMCT